MPDCWLKVSTHSEGPATGQLDQGFPWFSSVLEQILSWYPNSTLYCMPLMQPCQHQNFRPKVALPPISISKFLQSAALPRLISKFKIAHERIRPCSTSHPTFSTSKRLTFTKPIFARRTSGHCLGTFVAANLTLCSSRYKIMPIATPPTFSSPALLLLQRIKQDLQNEGYETIPHSLESVYS
jgi:hypothetical protein